jgi:transposase InsO family protein
LESAGRQFGEARLVARQRLSGKAAAAIALSTRRQLEVRDALELVQIDHTLADVILVESRRRPIGRPWLSVAIDVATRCILGVHVTFDAPSPLSVALCIEHACLLKERAHHRSRPSFPQGLIACIFGRMVAPDTDQHMQAPRAAGALLSAPKLPKQCAVSASHA